MIHGTRWVRGLTVGLLQAELATPAWAQEPTDKVAPGAVAPTMAEFNKLQTEVREQRQLLLEIMQSEQQRYDMLLRIIRAQTGAVIPEAAAQLPGVAIPTPAAAATASNVAAPVSGRARGEAPRRTGSIEGRVTVTGGGALGDVYVYVDVKGPNARGKTVEIRQQGKQFSPRLAVVQVGTNITFPNMDSVYHNVFSTSARNAFDLGSYRAGDKARSVTLTNAGVVDIFCNMHQKMNASVLVVPGPLFAKVRADGTFRIDNVPVGVRKLVAWSPNSKPSQQKVDVTGGGVQVSFDVEREESKAHLNKLGQAYGSYRD